MSESKPAYEYDMMPGPDGSRVLEIDPSSIRCQHCGKPWPECETILPNGELGCPCQVDAGELILDGERPALPVITDEHLRFLHGMIGKTWISADYSVTAEKGERLFAEALAALKEYKRMMEQWQ